MTTWQMVVRLDWITLLRRYRPRSPWVQASRNASNVIWFGMSTPSPEINAEAGWRATTSAL